MFATKEGFAEFVWKEVSSNVHLSGFLEGPPPLARIGLVISEVHGGTCLLLFLGELMAKSH